VNPILSPLESTLVNHLDLVVIDPAGMARSPWILDPLPIDEATYLEGLDPIQPAHVVPARRCVETVYWDLDGTASCEDHRNNLEQIVIDEPSSGWYEIRVRGNLVPEAPQRYSLVVSQSCED